MPSPWFQAGCRNHKDYCFWGLKYKHILKENKIIFFYLSVCRSSHWALSPLKHLLKLQYLLQKHIVMKNFVFCRGSKLRWFRKVSLLTRTPTTLQLAPPSRASSAAFYPAETARELVSKWLPPLQTESQLDTADTSTALNLPKVPEVWLLSKISQSMPDSSVLKPLGSGTGAHHFSSTVTPFIFTGTKCKKHK